MVPVAAVILAGGQSRRMGLNKVWLPRGLADPTPMWQHVVRVAATCCEDITVVVPPGVNRDGFAASLAAGESSTDASTCPQIRIVADQAAYMGPLQALAQAWPSVTLNQPERVLVLAADLPGLEASVLRALLASGERMDGAVIVREGRAQPLLGWYAAHCGDAIRDLADRGEERLMSALTQLRLAEVDTDGLGWPMWWTRPVHTQAEYRDWLQAAARGELA